MNRKLQIASIAPLERSKSTANTSPMIVGAMLYKICIPSFAPFRKISNTGTRLISPKTTIMQAKAGITNSICLSLFSFYTVERAGADKGCCKRTGGGNPYGNYNFKRRTDPVGLAQRGECCGQKLERGGVHNNKYNHFVACSIAFVVECM